MALTSWQTWLGVGLGSVPVGLYFLRKHINGPTYENKARLDGKVAIITGANNGLGKANAEEFARRGAKVYLACRSSERGQAAADDIKAATGAGDDRVIVMKLDLGSLKSVREFVAEFKKREKFLHILVNNAGVCFLPQSKTEDGFETTFGVNHLGHFLLTNLLLDEMKAAAPSRVVTMSSVACSWVDKINFDDVMLEKKYGYVAAYGQSKLANLMFSIELGKRMKGSGVTTYCVDPGDVNTDILRHMFVNKIPGVKQIVEGLSALLMKDIKHGAQTQVFCAVDEKLAQHTGKFYRDLAEASTNIVAQDEEMSRKLWELSEKLVGL